MSEYSSSEQPGINIEMFDGLHNSTTFDEIARYFKDDLVGKTLTTHLALGGEEDVVTAVTIFEVRVTNEGEIHLLTEDMFGLPIIHTIDGKRARYTESIYEENDLWFEDPEDSRVWYGIYDTPLLPQYVRITSTE